MRSVEMTAVLGCVLLGVQVTFAQTQTLPKVDLGYEIHQAIDFNVIPRRSRGWKCHAANSMHSKPRRCTTFPT